MSNPNAIVVATMDNSAINLVDNSAATIRGTAVYETCLYRTGFKSETNERAEFGFAAHTPNEGTIFCRFKCNKAFAGSDNIEYYLLSLYSASGDKFTVILHYTDAQSYDGPEFLVRNTGGTLVRLIANDVDFADGSVHSIALSWKIGSDGVNGQMYGWLDGYFIRSIAITAAAIPEVDRLYVGNADAAGNRPSMCTIEDVLYVRDALEPKAIKLLHGAALDTACVTDSTIYQPTTTVYGYARSEQSYYATHYDAAAGRLYGLLSTDLDQIHYSTDGGTTWTLYHDFADGVQTRACFTHDGYLFAERGGELYRATIGSTTFTGILTLTTDFRIIPTWGHTENAAGDTLVVSEYITGSSNDAKVYRTTDGGDNWTTVRTLSTASDHVHAVAYGPGDRLWMSYGDGEEGIEYSDDDGSNWTAVFNTANHAAAPSYQSIGFAFDGDNVLSASDSATLANLITRVNVVETGHGWEVGSVSALGPVTQPFVSNVYAIGFDSRGTLWLASNWESNAGKRSAIWVSFDQGKTVVMAEDLGEYNPNYHYGVYDTGAGVWIGNNKFNYVSAAGGSPTPLRRIKYGVGLGLGLGL